jgi:hypothetical protein
MYAARYQKNPAWFIIDTLKDYTPDGLFEKYSQLKQEYEAYLFQTR